MYRQTLDQPELRIHRGVIVSTAQRSRPDYGRLLFAFTTLPALRAGGISIEMDHFSPLPLSQYPALQSPDLSSFDPLA